MATQATSVLTLADWAKRLDPEGSTADIVEMLGETNEILDDMLFKEGNLPTGHQVTMRTGLPTPTWRKFNAGVAPSKSTTAQVQEHVGMLESWVETDKDLAELNGNVNAFRLSEAQAHFEAMSQEFASTLFYGDHTTSPEEFLGFDQRFNSLSAANAQNIIDVGGTGSDNSSIWLIGWGDNACYGIFPKGSRAGIVHEDLGLVTVETSAGVGGNRMRAYQDHWQWKGGLCVADWRYVVRACNVDISVLIADDTGATTNLINEMIKMTHRIPSLGRVKPCFYVNRTVFQMLDVQASNKAHLQLTVGEEEGKRKVMLRGIPIRMCDALTETESQIT